MALRGQAKISAAAVSTDRAEEFIATATDVLRERRLVNGYGHYQSRATVRSNLAHARDMLQAAYAALGEPADWPNQDDFEEV